MERTEEASKPLVLPDHRHMELKEIKTNGQNHYPEPTLTLWTKSATVFISRTVDVLDF